MREVEGWPPSKPMEEKMDNESIIICDLCDSLMENRVTDLINIADSEYAYKTFKCGIRYCLELQQ